MKQSKYLQGFWRLVKRAAFNLTDVEGDAWVLLALLEGPWPKSTKEIYEDVKSFGWPVGGYSYRTATRGLTLCVRKGLATRIRQGKYEPILEPLLEEILRLMKVSGGYGPAHRRSYRPMTRRS